MIKVKNLKVTVNGKIYDVQVEEIDKSQQSYNYIPTKNNEDRNYDAEVNNKIEEKFSKDKLQDFSDVQSVDSPMPGTVVSIKVKPGQSVLKGEALLVIEAMKMENEIMSPKDAVISEVKVNEGDTVESGAPLIFLKEEVK